MPDIGNNNALTAQEARELYSDPEWFIPNALYIKTKTGALDKFIPNAPQTKLLNEIKRQRAEGKPVRIIILKARQMGFSTLTEADCFHETITHQNFASLVVAHDLDSSRGLFEKSKLYYDKLPTLSFGRYIFPPPMIRNNNARMLNFENPSNDLRVRESNPGLRSVMRVSTANASGLGRSATYQYLHLSEYAFWGQNKEDTLMGLLQSVPSQPGTTVIIESTANGYEDFHQRWLDAEAGLSEFTPLFFAWFEMPDYRMKVLGNEMDDLDEAEKNLIELYGVDLEQLKWRRWCIANNCGGDIRKFEQEYPHCPSAAFLSTGECIFDKASINNRLARHGVPLRTGSFTYSIQYDENNYTLTRRELSDAAAPWVKIYAEPIPSRKYVIGGDTAGEGSDYYAAQVLDAETGQQCAVFHAQKVHDDIYAQQIVCLGYMYNNALIAVEVNFNTTPTSEMVRMRYPNMYIRKASDDSFTGKLKQSFGFRTAKDTRPKAISELTIAFRENPESIVDKHTLNEMLTFVRNERGKAEAQSGCHDDLVMALAIAEYVRDDMSYRSRKPDLSNELRKWSDDMYDDYLRANSEYRKEMERIWGKPDFQYYRSRR